MKTNNKKILRIAHKGASGYAPENTLAAFTKAIALSADMIEFDVRLAKTGEVVVIHDAKVNRTTNGKGKVKNLTLSQLKSLDAGNGEKIPTLEEALIRIGDRAKININVKDVIALTPTIKIIQKYRREKNITDDSIIVSAEKLGILLSAFKTPSVTTVPSLYIFPGLLLKFFKRKNPLAVTVYKRMLSKNLVALAHTFGIQVYAWTVNDKNEIEQMKQMDVDGIITDFPDRV